ncbi:MAG: NADH-quinone oxidoreductase subunit D-related protein, partial [Cellulomonas sp.]
EELLRMSAATTGHRLLRGAIRPGHVALLSLPDPAQLERIAADLAEIAELALANTVIRDRFTGTAVLTRVQARDLGCLGYVARASGVTTDARLEHPTIPLAVDVVGQSDGDVLSRFLVRRDEVEASTRLVTGLIRSATGRLVFDAEPVAGDRPDPRDDSDHPTGAGDQAAGPASSSPVRSGVGIVEGWRGTIVHRVEVDADGGLTRVAVVDPSWFNWPALPTAMTDTIVPDFPVSNKSFNLSYAGNDL